MERDVFICHASEDKIDVIFPLVAALEKKGIKSWVDEGEIKWGDSITQKVNEGLRNSRFVIVVLSEAFLGKNWPQRELFAVLNIEASSGEIKVLPLLVGDKNLRDQIMRDFPLLNDKRYETWNGNPEPIVKAALVRLSRTYEAVNPSKERNHDTTSPIEEIPLPKLRKQFTQREKDLFLKNAFIVIKDYFQRALPLFENQYPEAETDFSEIHTQKFIAKIYLHGNLKKQAKIWIGGLSAANEIAYSENFIGGIDSDNSFNELIIVEEDGFELYLKFSFGMMYQQESQGHFTPAKAAEMLWKRFSFQ